MTPTCRTLIALQLAALLLLGGIVTWRHHVWAPIDERAHYHYVQELVEESRIPRPTDLVSPEVQAITDNTWPEPSPILPQNISLGGRSYEAIQPPLYYFAAAPAWAIAPDHRDKVFVVRGFDLALVLLAAWLLWVLARRMAPESDAGPAYALALSVLLWPGVVVRGVTIGNTALELVLVAGVLLALWRADRRSDRRGPMLLAAVLMGAALLTKLALAYLLPVFLLVLARRMRGRPAAETIGFAVLPAAMLAPWIALNVSRYGSPTVNIEGGAGVVGQLAPGGLLDRLGGLWSRNSGMADGVLPQESWPQLEVWWVQGLVWILGAALVAGTVAALIARRGDWTVWTLALPAVSGLLITNGVYLLTGSEPFLLRYLYAALPPLALAIGLSAGARRATLAAAAASLLAGALWVDVAGADYFRDVGARLGI